MTTKLTLTVEKAIIERAKIYAKNTGRSLSELVEKYLETITEDNGNQKISPKLTTGLTGATALGVKAWMDDVKNTPPNTTLDDIAEGAGEMLDSTAIPQNLAMQQLAEKSGLKPEEESERNAFNIVDVASKKLGIPEDSIIANAGKALAVAGIDFFGDPVGLAFGGVNKINKGIKAANKVLTGAKKLDKAVETGKLVQKGTLAAGDLIKEKNLQQGQKIVQKLATKEDSFLGKYFAKDKLASDAKKAAGKFEPNTKLEKTDAKTFAEAVSKARDSSDLHKMNITVKFNCG
jgi:hypothetical protein